MSVPDKYKKKLAKLGVDEKEGAMWFEAFNEFDKDKSGYIEGDELQGVMQAMGQNPTKKEIQKLWKDNDENGDNKLNFGEFVAMVCDVAKSKDEVKDDLRQAFETFDKDGSGYLDEKELRAVFCQKGKDKLSDKDFKKMMKQIDVDSDGQISIEEFVKMLSSTNKTKLKDGKKAEPKQVQPKAGKAKSTEQDQLEQETLKAHNDYRKKHDAPPLQLDRKLCDFSQAYAEKLAKTMQMKHSDKKERQYEGKSTGENLASLGGPGTPEKLAATTMTGIQATDMWYNELHKPGYNFKKPGFDMGTGHFTQVVWKNSQLLGVGRADVIKDGKKLIYIVANYFPAGNVMDRFETNVVPAK